MNRAMLLSLVSRSAANKNCSIINNWTHSEKWSVVEIASNETLTNKFHDKTSLILLNSQNSNSMKRKEEMNCSNNKPCIRNAVNIRRIEHSLSRALQTFEIQSEIFLAIIPCIWGVIGWRSTSKNQLTSMSPQRRPSSSTWGRYSKF